MSPELSARLGLRPEIWATEDLKARWGMGGLELGHADTGMGMDEELAATMPLPATPELLLYAERTAAVATSIVSALTEDDLRHPALVAQARSTWLDPGPESRCLVFTWVVAYPWHDAEHLGSMRARAHLGSERDGDEEKSRAAPTWPATRAKARRGQVLSQR